MQLTNWNLNLNLQPSGLLPIASTNYITMCPYQLTVGKFNSAITLRISGVMDFVYCPEFWTIVDKVHKPSEFECYSPSS
jgi:hypothetical protein